MKLSDAIQRVDRSPQNTSWADIEVFARLFDINVYDSNDFGERIKHHWIAPWYCSDDVVGMSVYYMDDEPIAVQMRKARKSDRDIDFVSQAAANKVRDFIMEIKAKQGNTVPIIKNLEQDIGDDYGVAYGDQLLVKKAKYHGQPVEIVTTWRWSDNIDKTRRALIKYENGETEEVDVDDLKLAFRLTPEA